MDRKEFDEKEGSGFPARRKPTAAYLSRQFGLQGSLTLGMALVQAGSRAWLNRRRDICTGSLQLLSSPFCHSIARFLAQTALFRASTSLDPQHPSLVFGVWRSVAAATYQGEPPLGSTGRRVSRRHETLCQKRCTLRFGEFDGVATA